MRSHLIPSVLATLAVGCAADAPYPPTPGPSPAQRAIPDPPATPGPERPVGATSAPPSGRSAGIGEAEAIEIAKRAVAANDTWAERATYEAKRIGGNWNVIVWRIEGHDAAGKPRFVLGDHRLVVIDDDGTVTAYSRGR